MEFIPHQFHLGSITLFGFLILLGLVGTSLSNKSKAVPKVTAFMLVGLLCGPSFAGIMDEGVLQQAKPITDITLGIIMFNLGRTFKLEALKTLPGVWRMALYEAGLTMGFVAGGLWLLGAHWLSSLILGAIAIAASPAIILMVIEEFKPKGPVVSYALPLLTLNNMAAFLAFMLLIPLVYSNAAKLDVHAMVLHPLYLLAGSSALAYLLYLMTRIFTSKSISPFPLLVGVVALGIGLSKAINISPLLTNLILGAMISNLRKTDRIAETDFGGQEEIFFIILFVVAGAQMHVTDLLHNLQWALLFVLLRTLGKFAAFWAASPHSGMTLKQSAGLTGVLMPMAGMAIGLSQLTENLAPTLGSALTTLVFGSVAILETLGPILSEWALKMNKEIKSGVHH